MTALSPKAAEILAALRANKESTATRGGVAWGIVYLDNATPAGMSRHAFAGHLSALKTAGLYKPTSDDAFGEVVLA